MEGNSKRSSVFSRHPSKFARRSMDRIRRSFRDSFRRRGSKDRGLHSNSNGGDPSKPQQWQQDEASVRAGTCNFYVKYLGCVEVYESRGMQVCEEALKVLRAQRRRPVKGVLYVSGDGLRVVDAENKGLIVDQTIEKVSFCAPDRSHEKGFAYICRDGTTRRWMCHGFHAVKETGERLSHAVGCAFAVCLEKKQKRDRENGSLPTSSNSLNHIPSATSAPSSITATPAGKSMKNSNSVDGPSQGVNNFVRQGSFRQASLTERMQDPQNVIIADPVPPPKDLVIAPAAVPRPAPNPQLFERQGSLRMPAQNCAFRRNYSLRIGDLPSTLSRQQASGDGVLPGARVSAIPEEDATSPMEGGISGACKELTDNLRNMDLVKQQQWLAYSKSANLAINSNQSANLAGNSNQSANLAGNSNQSTNLAGNLRQLESVSPSSSLSARSRAEEWLESTLMSTTGQATPRDGVTPPAGNGYGPPGVSPPPLPPGLAGGQNQPMSGGHQGFSASANQEPSIDIFGQPRFIPPLPDRVPPIGHLRSQSLDVNSQGQGGYRNSEMVKNKPSPIVEDPFEAKWNALEKESQLQQQQQHVVSTNPFSAESGGVNI